jgi:mannosyltransferase OCH1-like enzyme
MLVDYQLRRYVMKKTLRKRQAKLDDMGVHLPDPPNMGRKKFPLLPNVAIGGMVIQSLEQATLLREMEVSADVYEKTCLKLDLPNNENSGDDMTKRPNDQRQKSSFSHLQSIPKVILQPTYIEWNQKQKRNLDNFHIISIEEAEMQKTVHMQCPELQGLYNAKESRQNRIDVWSICSLYRYGGVYLSESNQRIDRDIAFIFKTFVDDERDLDSINTPKNKVTTRECASPVGYLIVDQYSKNMSESTLAQSTPRIGMLAVSPRHPSLLCAMKKLSVPRANLNIAELLLESLGQAMLDNAASDSGSWMLSRRQRGVCDNMTTLPVTVSSMKMSSKDFDKINGPGSIFTKVRNANSLPLNGIIFQEGAAKYDVSVTERSGTSKPAQTPKLSLGDQLVALGSVPSWLCNRCLKTVSFGSFDKCRLVCSMRYQDVMCSMAQSPPKKKTVVDVTIRGDNSGGGDKRFIPRIIHQTWFEEPTALRYPQLVRLQNSWRASGWEYRFYTDDIAREYVLSNYPSRFLDAFDALIPGAFKVRRTKRGFQ